MNRFFRGGDDDPKKKDDSRDKADDKKEPTSRRMSPPRFGRKDDSDDKKDTGQRSPSGSGGSGSPGRRSTDVFNRGRTSPRDKGSDKKDDDQGSARPTGVFSQRSSPGSSGSGSNLFSRSRDSESGSSGSSPFRRSSPSDRNRSSAPSSSGSSPFRREDSPSDRNRSGSSSSGGPGSSPFGRGSSPGDRNRSGGTSSSGGSGSSPFNRGSGASSGAGSSGSSSRSPFSRGPSPRDRSSSGGPGGGGSSSSSSRTAGPSSGAGSSYRSYGGSTGSSSPRSPSGGPSGGPGARRPSRPAPSRPGDRQKDDKPSDSRKPKKEDKDSAPSRSFFRRGSKPDKKDDKKGSGDKPARPKGTDRSSKSSKPRRERKPKKDTAKSARSSRSSGKAKTLPKQSKAPQNVTQALSLDRKLDLLGIGLMIAALVMFAGWLQSTTAPEGAGGLSGSVDVLMAQLFGGARLLIPAAAAIIGGWLIVRHFGTMFDINYFRILGFVLLFFWIVTVLQWWALLFVEFPAQPNYVASVDELASQSEALWQDGEGGGLVGHIAYMFLVNMLGDYVLVPVLLGWVVFGMMFAFDLSVGSIADSWRERQRTREVRKKERAPVESPATAPTMVAASAGAAAGGGSVAVKEGTEAPTRRHQAAQKTAPPPPRREEKAAKPKRRGLFRRGRTEAPSEGPITPETDGDQPKRAPQSTAEDKGRKQAPTDAPITADTDGDQPKRRERSGILGRRQAAAASKETAAAKKTEAKPDTAPKRRRAEIEGRRPGEAPADRPITPETDGDQPKRAPKPAVEDRGRKQAPSGAPITPETDGDQPKRRAPTGIFGRRTSSAEQQEETTDKAAKQAAEDSPEKEPSADGQPGPARRLLNGLFGRKQEEAPSNQPITPETGGDQPKRAPKPAAENKGRKQAPAGAPIAPDTDGDQPKRRTPTGVFGRRKTPGERAPEDEKAKAATPEAKRSPAAERKLAEETAGPPRRGPFDRTGRRSAEAEVNEKPEAKPERADTERAAQEAPSRRPPEADSLAGQRRAPTGPLSEETQVTPNRRPPDADTAAERRPGESEGRRQPATSPFAPTTSTQATQDIFRRRPPPRTGEEGQRPAEKDSEKPEAADKQSTQVDQDTQAIQATSPTPAQESAPTHQLQREKPAAEAEEKAPTSPQDKQAPEKAKAEQPTEDTASKPDESTRQVQSAAAAMPAAEAISEPTRQVSQGKPDEDKVEEAEKPAPARRPDASNKDESDDTGEASSTDEWAVSASTGRRRPPPFTLASEAPDDVSTADAYRERLARRRPVQPGGADEATGGSRRPPSTPAASTREEQSAASASPSSERRGPVFFNREQQATAGRTAPPDDPSTDKGDIQDSGEESTATAQPARPRGIEFDSSARSMRRRDRRSVFRTSAGDLPTVGDDDSEGKPEEKAVEEEKEPAISPQAAQAIEEAVQADAESRAEEKEVKSAEAAEQKAATEAKSSKEADSKEEADDQAEEQDASVTTKADEAEEDEEDKTTTAAKQKQEVKPEKDTPKEEEEEPKEVKPEPAEAKQPAKKDKEAEKAEQEEEEEEEPGGSRWIRPDFLELLEGGSVREIDEQILLEQARIIEDTLESFGAPGNIVEINSGPVITQFGIEPAYIEKRGGSRSRVKVSAIASLEKDIALALAARSIRIEAPVPGKGFVGLEVPNTEAALVSLRDVMNSDQHHQKVEKTKLTISLGKRVDGTPLSADLTQMPHLLIAGTTGSGKSVCVNSIIGCLLLQNTPEELQFIMVDPKRVELTGYNGIPHLVAPVVVDLERIVGVLKWVQREMDDRYKRFASISARNILDYNRKIPEGQPNMPYLIVIVDELADLMMLAPEETERLIARLAQMARATGIHLIISTQRPSVDVVTGLIKANFPARIAFAVASSVDSRVILDQPGAEKLLGRGDMLYQAPDAAAPQRMQGVFVSDPELTRITQYWKSTRAVRGKSKVKANSDGDKPERKAEAANKPSIVIRRTAEGESGDGQTASEPTRPAGLSNKQQVFWEKLEAVTEAEDDMIDDEDTDELYDDAVELVRRRNKASISMLQRHFRIGYVRAARLIDLMEKQDVIGPAESGSKPRQVLPEDSD